MSNEAPVMQPTLRFRDDALRCALGPCVYVYFDGNGDAMYVGKSKNGIARAFASNHHKLRREMAAREVSIYAAEDEKSALILECELIRRLRPRLNHQRGSYRSRLLEADDDVAGQLAAMLAAELP